MHILEITVIFFELVKLNVRANYTAKFLAIIVLCESEICFVSRLFLPARSSKCHNLQKCKELFGHTM